MYFTWLRRVSLVTLGISVVSSGIFFLSVIWYFVVVVVVVLGFSSGCRDSIVAMSGLSGSSACGVLVPQAGIETCASPRIGRQIL